MKKIMCLLLLTSVIFAQAEIERANIDISISQYGSADVKEEFTLKVNEETAELFERLIEQKDSTIDSWKVLVPDLEQHVKSIKEPSISAKKQRLSTDTVEYKLGMEYKSPVFAELKTSEGRIEVWEVQNHMLEFYDISSKKFIVPEKNFISMGIEDTRKDPAELASDFFLITPKGIANGPYTQESDKVLFFINGPVLAENFNMQFKVEKPISKTFGMQNLIDFFMSNPIYLVVLVILIVLTIIFRKQIFALLQDTFIVEENIIMPRDRK